VERAWRRGACQELGEVRFNQLQQQHKPPDFVPNTFLEIVGHLIIGLHLAVEVSVTMINCVITDVSQQIETSRLLVDGTKSKRSKLAKLRGWSPMDLPVKWRFLAYRFDMYQVFQENDLGMLLM